MALQIPFVAEYFVVLLLFLVVTVPLVLAIVVLLNRRTDDDRADELESLRRRVDELEKRVESDSQNE